MKSRKKKILFLTGTRADFGKLKPLILEIEQSDLFELFLFVTGMHLNQRYGRTIEEVHKMKLQNVFPYYNHHDYDTMDTILAKTIDGFSAYTRDISPDLIVVHGDRVEALAGAIVGSLNNVLVAHIEGGEVSGTIDESIRHSVSKLSHLHFVANQKAKVRLKQMGEDSKAIFVIGSPDIDIMRSSKLPSLSFVKKYYGITFKDYGVLLFHPVTTEYSLIQSNVKNLVNALLKSKQNIIVIYPNNDLGCEFIFKEYERFNKISTFKIFPSLRFEYFLVLLKHAKLIIGNSSAGIREAPYYRVPTINLGTRQNMRSNDPDIINCNFIEEEILNAIKKTDLITLKQKKSFGEGSSSEQFLKIITKRNFWDVSTQKYFHDTRKKQYD